MGNNFAALRIVAFIALAVGICAAAATTSEPLLQISSYQTVPTEVYPGTMGYIQITLTNNGGATASSVTAYYTIDGMRQSISTNDIVAGSDSQISVPFKIRDTSGGNIEPVSIDVFYSFQSTSGASSKKSSLSIPLRVSQVNPLEVSTKLLEPQTIAPGEKVTVNFQIRNNGGVINAVSVESQPNSTFSLDGSNIKSVGMIPSNSTKDVKVTLLSSTDAKTGVYGIPLTVTYQDALNVPVIGTYYVGPISVRETSSQYRLSLVPRTNVEIGSETVFDIILENTGSSTISAVVDLNSTDVFMPIGVHRIYFDLVPPKDKVSKEVIIGVSSSKSAGFYTLPIKLTPNGGQMAQYDAGVVVTATPEITTYYDNSQATAQIQIANTGNSQIRSVYASIEQAGTQMASTPASTESFVGTLNVDDYATVSVPSGAPAQSYKVTVRFRDSVNQEKTITQTVDTTSGGAGSFNTSLRSGGFAGNSARGNFTSAQRNPLGFVLGPGGQQAGGNNSANTLFIIGAGAVVLVLAYFGYRKFFGKKAASK